jgi:hypothetical protein
MSQRTVSAKGEKGQFSITTSPISESDSAGEEDGELGGGRLCIYQRSARNRCNLQFKNKQKYNPWVVMQNSKLGCTTCKKVGSLGLETTVGIKLAKE